MTSAARSHALCAPSSADRWMVCLGSVAMEADEPDETNDAADEGTHAHDQAAIWLTTGRQPEGLNDEMRDALQIYVDFVQTRMRVHDLAGAKVSLFVEVSLPLQDVTGERNASGTADAVVIAEYAAHAELEVIDLKYGRGVEVDDDTRQLPIYALAAVRKYGLILEFTQVHTSVVQPRLRSEPNTVPHNIKDLELFGDEVMDRAGVALAILEDGPATALSHLTVSDNGCRFCKAKHKCPELIKHVHDTVYGEIQEITDPEIQPEAEDTFVGSRNDYEKLLPLFMKRVPAIETWCKYIRAKVEQLLLEGKPVEGFKLVQGRMGARKWIDERAVMAVMLGHHVPRELVMTLPEVRTPADLEKKMRKEFAPAWHAVQNLITQAPGSPSVAPADDARATWSAPAFDGDSYDAKGLV